MKWFIEAPSNIALIKYMGRKDNTDKIPANASLSYTLPALKSFVELELSSENASRWEFLEHPEALPLILSSQGQQRFLAHLEYLKNYFGCQKHFIVRSSNNFPQAAGLASSASSFAALTQCASKALSSVTHQKEPDWNTLAGLSRRSSGSSCRSFYAPWAYWHEETVEPVNLPYTQLLHQIIIIQQQEKPVLSSQAHQAVKTSSLYIGRPERAEIRLSALIQALKNQQWDKAFQITWDEFQDMHQLFKTAEPSFEYMTTASKNILEHLKAFWDAHDDGPLITMDAGPNIHLLYRPEQDEMMQYIKIDCLKNYHDITIQ